MAQRLQDMAVEVGGESGAKPSLERTKTRRDSFRAVADLTEHRSEFFHDHGGSNSPARLESSGKATKRMEPLLANVHQNMGKESSDGETSLSCSKIHEGEAKGYTRSNPEKV